jgi:hypothetical protein
MSECCGTCCWHEHENEHDEFVCTNQESEYYSDYTYYEFSCDDYESRCVK